MDITPNHGKVNDLITVSGYNFDSSICFTFPNESRIVALVSLIINIHYIPYLWFMG